MKLFKINYLLTSLFFFSFTATFFAQADYVPKGLLIFLDDSERAIEASSISLMTAISQNVGPIIASASLLANIFSNYNNRPTENAVELEKRHRRLFTLPTEELRGIYQRALEFNPNQWIIKEINPDLYFLIPEAYLNLQQVKRNSVEKTVKTPEATDIELQLGLKVNHMKLATFKDILELKVQEKEFADYFMKALSFQNLLTKKQESDIFCIHSDYRGRPIVQPIWSIYMIGHGLMKNSIVYLRLESFQDLLTFLAQKINCNLFVYTSCYAAGLNAKIIYEDAKTAIQRTYPFAIITQAITDAPTAIFKMVKVENNRLKLKTSFNFADFLKEVTASAVINYAKAAENLFPSTPDEKLKISGPAQWANVPQIKLPGIEWFSVMASKKDVVSIGSILAKTRDPQKPLNITTFFKTDPKAILLYAADIPFELIINSKNMEAIISMQPGDAIHKIKRISSTVNDTSSILDWFMKIQRLDPLKIFFVDSLNNVENIIIYNQKIPGNIMSRIPDEYINQAFYTENNKVYIKEKVGDQPHIADTGQEKKYQQLLAKMKGEVHNLGTFKNIDFIEAFHFFPEISSSSIIEKIEGKISIVDIRYEISIKLEPKAIAWIKEITGKYVKTSQFSLPDLDDGAYITINDVVIDKEKGIFFTYKGKYYQGDFFGRVKQIDDYRDKFKKRMKESFEPKEATEITPEFIARLKKVLLEPPTPMPTPAPTPEPAPTPVPTGLTDLSNALEKLRSKLDKLSSLLR